MLQRWKLYICIYTFKRTNENKRYKLWKRYYLASQWKLALRNERNCEITGFTKWKIVAWKFDWDRLNWNNSFWSLYLSFPFFSFFFDTWTVKSFLLFFYGNTGWKIENEKFEICGNVKFITEIEIWSWSRDKSFVLTVLNFLVFHWCSDISINDNNPFVIFFSEAKETKFKN